MERYELEMASKNFSASLWCFCQVSKGSSMLAVAARCPAEPGLHFNCSQIRTLLQRFTSKRLKAPCRIYTYIYICINTHDYKCIMFDDLPANLDFTLGRHSYSVSDVSTWVEGLAMTRLLLEFRANPNQAGRGRLKLVYWIRKVEWQEKQLWSRN